MSTWAEAFVRLRVDGAMLRRDTTEALKGTDAEAAGGKAGSSYSKGFGSKIGGIATKITAVMGVAAVGVAAESTKMAIDFQKSTASLVTDAGVAQKNLGKIQQGIKQISVLTGQSTTDLVSAEYTIASAGYAGVAGLRVLKAAAEGARTGNADLATVADTVTTVLKDYNLQGADATRVTSQLVDTVAHGKTHLQDLASSLARVLPTAAALGISFPQVGGAMAAMTARGTSARLAAMGLNSTLLALASPTGIASKQMDMLSLSTANAAKYSALLAAGNTKGAAAFLAQRNASSKLSATLTHQGLIAALQLVNHWALQAGPKGSGPYIGAMKAMTGGSNGLRVALQLTSHNMSDVISDTKAIGDTAKTTGKNVRDWGVVTHTAAYQLSVFRSEVQVAALNLGQKLLPILVTLMGFVSHHTAGVLIFAAAFAGVAVTIAAVAKAIQAYKATVSIITGITGAVKALHYSLLGTRIELAALWVQQKVQAGAVAIWGGVTAAITEVRDGTLLLRLQLFDLWVEQKIQAGATAIWGGITAAIRGAGDGTLLMRGQLAALWVQQKIIGGAQAIWTGITGAVKAVRYSLLLTRAELAALWVQQKIIAAAVAIWKGIGLAITAVRDGTLLLRLQMAALWVQQQVIFEATGIWGGLAVAINAVRGSTVAVRVSLAALWVQQKVLAGATAIWAAITVAINAVKDAQIGARIATLAVSAATKVAAAAQWLWNVAMDANPLGLIIIAITGIVAALIYAYNHFTWFRDGVNAVWSWIAGHWKLLLVILTGPIGLAVVIIISKWALIKQGTADVVGFIRQHWGLIFGILTAGIGPAIVWIVKHWGDITAAASQMIHDVRVSFAAFVNFILGIFGKIITGAAAAFGWIPGLGNSLKSAAAAFTRFRNSVNASLLGIQSRTVTVGVSFVASGGAPQITVPGGGKADGGLITGPGGPRDDKAGLFWLSNKEYVHNAAAVSHYGVAFMQAVNARQYPKMAKGGTPAPAGVAMSDLFPARPKMQAAIWPPVEKLAARMVKIGGAWNPIVGDAIAATLLSYVGKAPYLWGGTAPSGWDCSGAVLNVLRRYGFNPPRTAAEQQAWATPIGQPLTGAMVFFAGADGTAKDAGHVGFVTQPGRYVSAYGTGFGTIVEPIIGSSGAFGGYGIPPGNSFARGGIIPEPVAGIGLRSGQRYQFGERGTEVVTSEAGMAVLASLLAELIDAVNGSSARTGKIIGAALGGAASTAVNRAIHSPR